MLMKTYILIFIFIFILFPVRAMAYLDPGSGSMILQIILGGIAGLLLIIKFYWDRFLKMIKIRKKTDGPET